ncbi:hypothetical protein Tco_0680929 [Tanacetum coccineum]|uniref:Reverse transcriptase Ty1/copia-type domain-containing protein n=1 Tax=Tanacetum coccineum TaxID=301880 RepID=A0ABQ4XN15_9ASTR
MTPATTSSGLVPNPPPSTPFVPPLRTDWDILFQPLCSQFTAVIKYGSPSSTYSWNRCTIPSNSQKTPKTHSPILPNDVEEDNHDLDVAHINNDPFFGITIPENDSEASSSDVIPTVISVSTRLKLHEQALFCYYDAFLTSVEPKNYKDALTQACWIEAIIRLTCVARGYRHDREELIFEESFCSEWLDWCSSFFLAYAANMNMIVYQMDVKTEFLIDILARRSLSKPVDTPMVEKSKLDEDPQGKSVDLTLYRGMVGTLMYLTAKQVENGVVELYFVNTEYKLAEIFTKVLCRERIEFLINKLGMRSFTPETLKQLADEAEE